MAVIAPANCVMLPVSPGEQKKTLLKNKSTSLFERLDKDFTSLDVNNRYGSVKVNVSPLSVFEIIGHIRYGSIVYPDKNSVNKITESNETTINGVIGEGQPKSKMKISAKYTTVKINTIE